MNVEPRKPHEPGAEKDREVIAPGESQTGEPAPAPAPLTPEEQMAAFEQELKETDWGHQPC